MTNHRINPEFSFSVFKDLNNEKSNPITYYFEVDEDNEPIHLGDGSYGMVYRVSDRMNGNPPGEFAVKIFYESEELNDRFDEELSFYEEIRGKITKLGLGEKIQGLIEPKGGTKSFDKSDVAKNYFKKAKFRISPYAIVMDCYDGSLKDRLETRGLKSKYTGYDALLACSFDQRIKAMYRFVDGITNGLKYLYVDDNAHLDIKPANIFYKKRGMNFDVILADVGFFSAKDSRKNPNINSLKKRTEQKRKQLLGSIHYRSPEQKYDIDRCQAKIEIDDKLKIIITDPKFTDSLIETGDRLVFTKYFARKRHRIKSFVKSKEPEPFKVEIQLDSEIDLKKSIEEEKKTQVELLKMQRIRTDLFGIGAIAFDILTGGSSPERFYEKISSQDFEKNSINNIIDKYIDVTNRSNDETEFLYIFNSFINNNKFANRKIVEFILKCMLYKAKGTFYHEHSIVGQKKDYEVIDEVLIYFKKHFEDDYADQIALNARLNPIIAQTKVAEAENLSEHKLDEYIQKISAIPSTNYSERLFHGMKTFEALITFLENNVLNPNPSIAKGNSYLAELRPDILFMDDNYSIRINLMAYPTKDKFLEGLKSHNAQNKLNTKFSHFFVPQEVVSFRRIVKLTRMSGNRNEFYYDFLDRSFHSDNFKKGDFLVSESTNSNKNNLYRITAVISSSPKEVIKIEALNEEEEKSQIDFEEDIFFFYRNLDSKYYMHMLGVYLQHIFFANLGTNSKNLPSRLFSILYLDQIPLKKLRLKPIHSSLNNSNAKTNSEKLSNIFYLITRIFLGLILSGRLEDDYSIRNINQIQKAFTQLKMHAIDYLKIGQADFNKASIERIQKSYERSDLNTGLHLDATGENSEFILEKIIEKILIDPNERNVIERFSDKLKQVKGRIVRNKKIMPLSNSIDDLTPMTKEFLKPKDEEE